jgi:hypothetical protein
MNTFFICSLPRSRTAWLANFLCYDPCHCFHEPFNEYAIEDLPELFQSTRKEYVGISDSTNTLFIEPILKVFPSSKLVLIRRPSHEVDQRMRELGLPCHQLIMRLDSILDEIEENHNPLVVNYHSFNASAIWAYLIPEVPLNIERLKMLETFDVTVPKTILVRKGLEFVKKHILAE